MAFPYVQARTAFSSALRPLRAPRLPTPTTTSLSRSGARRPASTSASQAAGASLLLARTKTALFGTAAAASLYVAYLYATDTRASFHRFLVPRLLRLLLPDAEDAHHAGTVALATLHAVNLHPRERDPLASDAGLAVSVFGARAANPVGISAGLDKDADVPDALFDLGAGVVEVGGCTPRPQAGNPRPRVFRVPAVDGMVNRYGLNSRGADAMAARLRHRLRAYAQARGLTEADVLDGSAGVQPGSLRPDRLLLVQIAKNKDTDGRDVDAVAADYTYCVSRLAPYADVLVVNVSSPNTPGLRDLQAAEPLARILGAVVDEATRVAGRSRSRRARVMVKVSPDEDEDAQMEGICQAVWRSGVDGVIVGNTTNRRAGLVPQGVRLSGKEQKALAETGGFSGPAMFERTLDLVGRYRKMLDGQSLAGDHGSEAGGTAAAVPALEGTVSGKAHKSGADQKVIFATGGITNGQQALKILNAGASVAMVYTGMVYGGAGTVTRIKSEMRQELTGEKSS